MPSTEQHTVKKRLINILSKLAGQKASQAAGKAQEGRVDTKVELQLGHPVLVMTLSLGFVFLTLHRSNSCSVALPCQPPVCDKSLRGWAGGEHHWYPTKARVLSAPSSPCPEFLLFYCCCFWGREGVLWVTGSPWLIYLLWC